MRDRRLNFQQRLLGLVGQDWRLAAGLARLEFASTQQYERHKRFAALRRGASLRYAPSDRVQTELLLVRAHEPEFQVGAKIDPSYGWSPYVTGPVADLPGTHRQLLDSSANRLAIAAAISARMHAHDLPSSRCLPGAGRGHLTSLAHE
jgi:hypothetical protein